MATNMRSPSNVSQILVALISVIYLAQCDTHNIDIVRSRRQLSNSNYYQWITGNTRLPRADWMSAIGTYNNTIYIFGGAGGPDDNGQQLVQFDITSQNFVDLGRKTLPMNVYGFCQFYTQSNETTLYWIDDNSGNTIVRYDLETKSIHSNVTTNIPGYNGCLASYNNSLYVLGGGHQGITSNAVFSYDIISNKWTVLPSMQQKREAFACIINSMTQVLYAIGGYNYEAYNGKYLGSIELISLFGIENNKWIYIESMSRHWAGMRAVVWNQNVLLIGGFNETLDPISEMLLINGTNDKVYSVGNLSYPVCYVANILVKDRVYAFGGMINDKFAVVSWWQYLDL
eukprot:464318_1